jgi:peptidoglycan hydrolase-like protein with peptidoglycan-binding domain
MRAPARLRTALRRLLVPVVAVAVAVSCVPADAVAPRERTGPHAPVAAGTGPVTRGLLRATTQGVDRWTGYAFDACRAPSSAVMDRWRVASPFLGAGIYIGGALRACPQRHLTRGWVEHQTRQGWRLLPIWVGPQASCTSYHRRIKSHPGAQGRYPGARSQGIRAARGARAAASRLGLGRGSTLWYDLEWFPTGNSKCRKSSLHFLSAWTRELHRTGYLSGIYSSVSAGVAVMGRERGNRSYTAPDRVWFAWANGRTDVSWNKYLAAPRWKTDHRVHQYALDVTASYGGVRMAIDRNFVDLGSSGAARRTPAVCGPTADRPRYRSLHRGVQGSPVRVVQCLLRATGRYGGDTGGSYGEQTRVAVESFQRDRGLKPTGRVNDRTWTALLAAGSRPVLKRGSEGTAVRRVQRALTAALAGAVAVHGHFGPGTANAVRRYQARHGLRVSGVVTPGTWHALRTGAPVVRHHHKGHGKHHGKHAHTKKAGHAKHHGKQGKHQKPGKAHPKKGHDKHGKGHAKKHHRR